MNTQQKIELTKMLTIQAQMKEQALSDDVLSYMITELQEYDFNGVMAALRKLGKESVYKINLAEIISRIDDGRPSAQLAWTQCPKNEDDSAVLTEEQNRALCSVSKQFNTGDKVGARMAFIENYNALIEKARADAEPVKWVLAAGDDREMRKDVVKAAVQDGRLLKKRACWMLQHTCDDDILALDSPKEPPLMIEGGRQSGKSVGRIGDIASGLANGMRVQA